MNENEEIFRKKSLDRVKSPETLDDYIRVSNPGIWLLLVSVIVLLAGACVWGIFGHIDSTAAVTVRVDGGVAVCYVAEEDIASVRTGMTVKFDGFEAVVVGIGSGEEGKISCALGTEQAIPDGYYDGKIVLASERPIRFVLN